MRDVRLRGNESAVATLFVEGQVQKSKLRRVDAERARGGARFTAANQTFEVSNLCSVCTEGAFVFKLLFDGLRITEVGFACTILT